MKGIRYTLVGALLGLLLGALAAYVGARLLGAVISGLLDLVYLDSPGRLPEDDTWSLVRQMAYQLVPAGAAAGALLGGLVDLARRCWRARHPQALPAGQHQPGEPGVAAG